MDGYRPGSDAWVHDAPLAWNRRVNNSKDARLISAAPELLKGDGMYFKALMIGSFMLASYYLFRGDHAMAAYSMGVVNLSAMGVLRDEIQKRG